MFKWIHIPPRIHNDAWSWMILLCFPSEPIFILKHFEWKNRSDAFSVVLYQRANIRTLMYCEIRFVSLSACFRVLLILHCSLLIPLKVYLFIFAVIMYITCCGVMNINRLLNYPFCMLHVVCFRVGVTVVLGNCIVLIPVSHLTFY
jgi:hypothetical protein